MAFVARKATSQIKPVTYAQAAQQPQTPATAQKPATHQELFEMDQKLERGEITYADYQKFWNANYKPSGGTTGSTTAQQPQQPQTPAQQAAGRTPYVIGTEQGADVYNKVLSTGQRAEMNDGTILSKGPDGKVYAYLDGVWVGTNVTYQTPAQKNQTDAENLAAALGQIFGRNGDYAKAQANAQAAQRAAAQKAVNDLEEQKDTTNRSYADLFRQLYINKMNTQKNEDQKLAAQGITGGMAETSRLGVETSYSEALRQGETDRVAAIGALDTAIANAKLEGDIATANVGAEIALQKAGAQTQVVQNLLNRSDNLSATDRANARALALDMLQRGEMPSSNILTDANISYSDALSLLASPYTEQQAQAALMSARNGVITENTKAIIESYYGMSVDEMLASMANSSVYTADQAAMALAAAKNGATDEKTRAIVESFYGIPLESALTSMAGVSNYTAEQAAVALQAAMHGSTDPQVVKIVEDYYKMPVAAALQAQPKSSKYTADQAAAALLIAKTGDTSPEVREIVEDYYGLPLESVLKSSYMDAQISVAVNAALAGNRDEKTRTVIENYFGMPLETVLLGYGG